MPAISCYEFKKTFGSSLGGAESQVKCKEKLQSQKRQSLLAYRGQFEVEHAFEQMKEPHTVAWSPMFHRTDSKIRVHAFYCVLALTLTSLLRREVLRKAALAEINLDDTSINGVLDTLAGIKQVANIYPPDSGIRLPPHA